MQMTSPRFEQSAHEGLGIAGLRTAVTPSEPQFAAQRAGTPRAAMPVTGPSRPAASGQSLEVGTHALRRLPNVPMDDDPAALPPCAAAG